MKNPKSDGDRVLEGCCFYAALFSLAMLVIVVGIATITHDPTYTRASLGLAIAFCFFASGWLVPKVTEWFDR